MAAQKGKLSRNREKAIAGLILKSSISEAAQYAGIGERTLLRWLKDDDFKKAYCEARYHLVQHALTQIQGATKDAVQVLKKIANNKKAPDSVRLRAASVILSYAVKSIEIENLEARITDLEQIIQKN
jgi:hypothetical protein